MKTLDNCKNMFGKLSPMLQNKIKKYIKNPSCDQWEEIAHIIINPEGQMKTIWQSVIDLDPAFPITGRRTDSYGNILREWERIPEPLLVLQAIKQTTR